MSGNGSPHFLRLLALTDNPMDAKLRSLIKKVRKEHDDDVVDRTIYATTVYILGFFAVLTLAKSYVGEPLQCWVPAEYTGAWEKYIENYCFVENTYFVNKTIPDIRSERKQLELRYYQWIPYLLSIQALLCYAPKLVFKLLYSFSDLRVADLVQLAYKESKAKFGSAIGPNIASQLMLRRDAKVRLQFDWYLTAIFLFMKFLFIGSLVVQLLLMYYFVGASSPFWGLEILVGLIRGEDWRSTGLFPRVTFCDLKTRDLGQSRDHTIQCVLMINMFAEKIYVFLWLWTHVLLALCILNLFSWIFRSLNAKSKIGFVRDALRLHQLHPSDGEIRHFIEKFLRLDGIVVLRLIDSNAGYVHMADILSELWRKYGSGNHFSPIGTMEKKPL